MSESLSDLHHLPQSQSTAQLAKACTVLYLTCTVLYLCVLRRHLLLNGSTRRQSQEGIWPDEPRLVLQLPQLLDSRGLPGFKPRSSAFRRAASASSQAWPPG